MKSPALLMYESRCPGCAVMTMLAESPGAKTFHVKSVLGGDGTQTLTFLGPSGR